MPSSSGPTSFGEITRTLRSDVARATVTALGATLLELHVPDRHGETADVVLGYPSVEGYRSPRNPYVGATIGRVANRIANGRFNIGDDRYELARNEPPHHVHGGAVRSFDKVVWEVVDSDDDRIVLRYVSVDGEEGFPGQVEAIATYRLAGDVLSVRYEATTDALTPLNMTNHSYFNLAGAATGADILDHEVSIDAEGTAEVDAALIPTGVVLPLDGSALDLRRTRRVGERIDELRDTPSRGYDHHYLLATPPGVERPAAVVRHPASGRVLLLTTDQPGVQFYSGNRIEDLPVGKGGIRYRRHAGLCLEPQHAPDSVNHDRFPSILIAPGQRYRNHSSYRFSVS